MPVSKNRLYVNADKSKIVPEDSEEAAFLLVGAGGELTHEQAKQYGLKKRDFAGESDDDEPEPEHEPEPEAKAVEEADNKAVTEAPENKAHYARGHKGKD